MAKQIINVGATVNDKSGDPLRTAFIKVNENFDELYSLVGSGGAANIGNWQFTGNTATVSGATAQIGKNSSETITQEEVGGTISQTTTNTSQVAISASSVVITRSVTQVVDDGVLVATDEAGSVASIGNGTAYLKTYSEPDGPNNTQYAEVGTSGTYAYLESRQDDVGGYTLGSVVTGPGTVSITAHSTDDKTWLFDQEGILTVPESSGITGINDFNISSQSGDNSSGLFLNGNPLVGSAILYANNTAVIRSDNNGNIKDWNFDRSGTITTPLMLPATFTAVLDDAHMVDPIGFASEDPWWQFGVAFQVDPNGTVQTYMDNPFPVLTNPGYVSGFTFRFTEADHGIPGFTFDITLNDVVLPGGAGWTANVAVTQPPEYPSTINTSGAIKLTSNSSSWTFGTTGVITLPAGGDIVDSTGTSVLGGSTGPYRLVEPPVSLQGASGDQIGDVAFDGTNVYYCGTNYSAGESYSVTASSGAPGVPYINITAGVFTPQVGWTISDGVTTRTITGVTDNTSSWYLNLNGMFTSVNGNTYTLSAGAPVSDIWSTISQTSTGNITFTNSNISSTTGYFRLTGGENATIEIPQAGSGNPLKVYAGEDNPWTFAADGSLRTPHNTIYTDQNAGTALVANTPTLIFTSANAPWVGGVKLLLIAQGSLTGQSSSESGNQWHTQMAEALVANRPWGNTSDPVMSVYGVTYTSANPFVTYTVNKNATSGAIEVYATTTESTYTIRVRANATHVNAY